jgi:hypothetical protein
MDAGQIKDKIIRRCQDVELGLGASPGGPLDPLIRQLSNDDVLDLINYLDYLTRGDPYTPQWRYNNLIDFLRTNLTHRSKLEQNIKFGHLAQLAREQKRETCECGAKHTAGSKYYVSAIDGKKTVLLSGPYATHAEAVALVDEIKDLAIKLDPKAAFASFGTVAMKSTYRKKGILDRYK